MARRSACTNGHRELRSAQFREGSISTIRVVSVVSPSFLVLVSMLLPAR